MYFIVDRIVESMKPAIGFYIVSKDSAPFDENFFHENSWDLLKALWKQLVTANFAELELVKMEGVGYFRETKCNKNLCNELIAILSTFEQNIIDMASYTSYIDK